MSYQLVKLANACKCYGSQVILNKISFTISQGDRVALVGENGAGKSTLAKIILGHESLDGGSLELASDIEIGYLPQEMDPGAIQAETVRDYLLTSQNQLKTLIDRKIYIEEVLAGNLAPQEQAQLMQEWNNCHEAIERRGGYDCEHRIIRVLTGLDLVHLDLSFSLSKLSGGQKTRLGLAALLLSNPDVLILDEPTNHLDLPALEWLEKYLLDYPGALILISHDRMFINRVVHRMVEISRQTRQMKVYGGNYDFYVEEKRKDLERRLKEYEERKEEIQSLKQLIKAKTFSKSSPRLPSDRNIMAYDRRGERHMKGESRSIQQAKSRLEEFQEEPLDNPRPKNYQGIRFYPDKLHSAYAIELHRLSKQYPGTCLFEEATAALTKGERVVLMGPNGSGKSTLLRIIMGLTPMDSGEVKIAPSAKIGYLDQDIDLLDRKATAMEVFGKAFSLTETDLRNELHKAGLPIEGSLDQKIDSFSLGQRKRLQILYLMLSRCNVLLLDEPTNHLDMATMENFEDALKNFEGAVLAISHDRWFVERIATKICAWRMDGC